MPPLKSVPGWWIRRGKLITDQEEFYSGCYGYASINFYPFNAKGNVGVAAGLNNVMKVKDGESLGGRVSADADFAEVDMADAPFPMGDDSEPTDIFGD